MVILFRQTGSRVDLVVKVQIHDVVKPGRWNCLVQHKTTRISHRLQNRTIDDTNNPDTYDKVHRQLVRPLH